MQKVYVFSDIDWVTSDKYGCYLEGYYLAKRHDGRIQITGSKEWYHPMSVYRYYWIGAFMVKFCTKFPRLYKFLFL